MRNPIYPLLRKTSFKLVLCAWVAGRKIAVMNFSVVTWVVVSARR